MKAKIIAGLLTLGLSTTALAATTKYILSSSATNSQISGSGGDYVLEVGPDGEYQGLYAFALEESGDRPCRVVTRSRHLNTSSEQYQNGEIAASCTNPGSQKEVAFTNRDTYIRGVQVCWADNMVLKRVKGVRIYGAKLNKSTGALVNTSGYKEFSRTNCDTWKPAKFCGAGKVATGVNMQYHLNYAFDGISLECRSVNPK